MKIEPKSRVAHEAVGVFNRSEDFQDAIDELLSSGFHRAELSLLASERAVQEKLGHRYKKVNELQDNPRVPRTAYVSTEAIGGAEGGLIGALMYVGATAAAGVIVVSGGTLAGVIAAMALAGGAGGLIGTLLARWIGDHHARYLQEQMDHGGLLLWVRTRDVEKEKRATEILSKHSGRDVHLHALPAAA
jgi:hypothetical protein